MAQGLPANRPQRRRPRRGARRARWGGLALALLLFVIDFASRPLYFFATPFSRMHIGLAKGSVRVLYREGVRVNDWGIEINGTGEPTFWWFHVARLGASSIDLTVPLWPFLALSIAVTAWGWTRRRRERRAGHICPRCGYDLTGIAGPCPECGHAERQSRETAHPG